jgi:SAM-dependent methyltransferase
MDAQEQRQWLRSTFDQFAELYGQTRPVCPPALFDDLVALAGLAPGARVVEVGAGTGQATRPLAERGLSVVAVELGPRLAAIARRYLADCPQAEVVTGPFEAWEPAGLFDAVVSVNAFHWIDPDVRFAKAASVLTERGALVLAACQWVIPEDAERFWFDVQDDWAAVGCERVDPVSKHPDKVTDFAETITASGLFRVIGSRRYPFTVWFSADNYVDNLRTQSGLRELDDTTRDELLRRVHRRIEAARGQLRADLVATLNVALRA